MLSHQRWPYVGRFARGWHRLPGKIPGQPQTRTRAHPRIGSRTLLTQRAALGERPRCGEGVHLDRAGTPKRLGRGRERRAGREDVVDEQHARRRWPNGAERPGHGRPAIHAGAPSLGRRVDLPPEQAQARPTEPSGDGNRQRARLVVAALGATGARERDPRDGVDRRELVGRGHRVGERGSHVAPARELQPVHRTPGRTGVRERSPRRRQRCGWTVFARPNGRARRRTASLAPRRPQRSELTGTRGAEGPRAVTAPSARTREHRVERPRPHGATLPGATDTTRSSGYGRGISIGDSPLSWIARRWWARSTG
jgi:hypothetical protein